jgi:hypothetical protein
MDITEVHRILSALAAVGYEPSLAGGWGVDALVGLRRAADRDSAPQKWDWRLFSEHGAETASEELWIQTDSCDFKGGPSRSTARNGRYST